MELENQKLLNDLKKTELSMKEAVYEKEMLQKKERKEWETRLLDRDECIKKLNASVEKLKADYAASEEECKGKVTINFQCLYLSISFTHTTLFTVYFDSFSNMKGIFKYVNSMFVFFSL